MKCEEESKVNKMKKISTQLHELVSQKMSAENCSPNTTTTTKVRVSLIAWESLIKRCTPTVLTVKRAKTLTQILSGKLTLRPATPDSLILDDGPGCLTDQNSFRLKVGGGDREEDVDDGDRDLGELVCTIRAEHSGRTVTSRR